MCLHDAVIAYAKPRYPEQMGDKALFAEQMLMRGMSEVSLSDDPDTLDLEWVANETAVGKWPAIEATYFLAASEAKGTAPDLDNLRHWVNQHYQQINAADAEPHDLSKWCSRYHRVRAFIPQFEKNKESVTFELDLAEICAEEMNDGVEKKTLQMALSETRTEEALMLGDIPLAVKRAERYVELNPLDSQSYLKLGKALAVGSNHAAAARAYLKAAQYCPPSTEIVKFSLGYCYEQLGMLAEAQDAYLAALNSDPEGYSSLEQLIEVAGRLKNHALAEWAKHRLGALDIKPDEPKPYQLTTASK
jgi:tetratricopeptide (TPR) repeat protein